MVALIPARKGSKSVINKNRRIVWGKPLLAHSIEMASVLGITPFVSTDCRKLTELSHAFGAVVIPRPEEISQDKSTDYEWLVHAIKWLKLPKDETILFLRPTTPIRDVQVMRDAINHFKLHTASSLRSAHPANESPFKYFRLAGKYFTPYLTGWIEIGDVTNMPRQNFLQAYVPNGYIDIVKVSVIKKGSVYGSKILSYITPKVIEIDTEEDLVLLNHLSHCECE